MKPFLFGAWLSAVLAVGALLVAQPRFFQAATALVSRPRLFGSGAAPVARLATRSGVVRIRHDGAATWQEGDEGQTVYDGDRVSTGPGSRATVELGKGRSLELASGTQVQVTAIVREGRPPAFLLAIVRGAIVGDVTDECQDCPPLIVRAGSDTHMVNKGERVGVFRPVGKRAKTFDPKGPWPSEH
jgi:ferric-dicitrate binding protein FerR (iron transport regulator)